MENNFIQTEQLLFGYSNGHHLLTTSILLAERTQKTLEVLSDLSGPDVQDGFTEYITGYPLENENFYALSKTWYAPEMKRPGCVWTHMILFKYEDLNKIKYCKDLFSLFVRPNIDADINDYSKPINILYFKDFTLSEKFSMERLRFIEWAVYSNNDPIVIPADTADEYVHEIHRFWLNQDERFMRKFSFCTGVLANRHIEKRIIDLQVVPHNLLRSISRQNKELKALDISPEKVKYPVWVNYMIDENRSSIMREFYTFRKNFGEKYLSKQYFSSFAQIYIETGIIHKRARLQEFFDFVSSIFLEDDATSIKNTIVQQLLKGYHLEWFNYKSIIDIILDLSTKIDLYDLNIKCISVNEVIDMLWNSYTDKVNYVFQKLIDNNMNLLGENLIKVFAVKTSPEQLCELTGMNLGLCNLMVKLDVKFALCSDIWSQSRDFQVEIINCIEFDYANIEQAQQILITILENTSFDFCDQIYKKFGDLAISTFLEWYRVTNVSDDRKVKWMKLCEKNPSRCIQWMISTDRPKDILLMVRVINILDPYSYEVLRVDNSFWTDIFYNLNVKHLNDEFKLILAQFFMPIILLKKELFPSDFVQFSFNVIHNRVAEQKFDYERWEKIEKLLPEVVWYNSWDKCKRLRKAIDEKGYKIE